MIGCAVALDACSVRWSAPFAARPAAVAGSCGRRPSLPSRASQLGARAVSPATARAATGSPARESAPRDRAPATSSAQGPPLRGVGALAADFYLRTGYMPLSSTHDQPGNDRVLFSDKEIRSLERYVASLGPGPAIPHPDPAAGSIEAGTQLFTEHCAGCHQEQARGGFVTGARVPPLQTRERHADRRGGPDRALSDAALLAQRDLRCPAELDRQVRPEHQPPRQPRRLGDRQPRTRFPRAWSRGGSPPRCCCCPAWPSEGGCAAHEALAMAVRAHLSVACLRRRPPRRELDRDAGADRARRYAPSAPAENLVLVLLGLGVAVRARVRRHLRRVQCRRHVQRAARDLPRRVPGLRRRGAHRRGQAAGGHRGARGRLPRRAPRAAARGRGDRPRERSRITRKRLLHRRRRRDRRRRWDWPR